MGKRVIKRSDLNPHDVKVGKAVHDILSKPQDSQDVGETLEAMTPKYIEGLKEACKNGSNLYSSPFYVVVLGKKEVYALNVVHQWYIARQTKPNSQVLLKDYPNHFQEVFEYNEVTGDCRLLWSLTATWNHKEILDHPETYDEQLVKWHQDHYAGTLA